MAAGDLTASTPILCESATAIKTAIDSLNISAATDFVFVVPVVGRDGCYYVFKVERAAA